MKLFDFLAGKGYVQRTFYKKTTKNVSDTCTKYKKNEHRRS